MNKILKYLRQHHYFYCLGKRPKVLEVSCEYIEGVIKGERITQRQLEKKYNVSRVSIRNRAKEIMKFLVEDDMLTRAERKKYADHVKRYRGKPVAS